MTYVMLSLAVLTFTLTVAVNGEKGAFTTFVNLEKLYSMEEELITVSSVILSQEKVLHGAEDVHGIYNISTTVDNAKSIHGVIVSARNITAYIVHPINIFHLVKRLSRDWNKVISVLEDSKSCAKAMRIKIENMADNVPSSAHLKLVTESLLRVQALYNLSADDIISGDVSNYTSQAPLTLDDVFDIARTASDTDQHMLAIDWLKYLVANYDESSASFSISNALSVLSSSYLKLQLPQDALKTIDKILEIDPDNNMAKRNREYIMTKIHEGIRGTKTNIPYVRTKKERSLQKFCPSKSTKASKDNLYCTYTKRRDTRPYFDKPDIKTEVLSRRPLILLYHDLTNTSQQKAVKHLGYERMQNLLYKEYYMYPNGIDGTYVEDWTRWQWIPNLRRTLDNIDLTHANIDYSHFFVKNVGLEGHETTPLDQAERHLLGTFVIFLTSPAHGGGNIVFPTLNTTIVPEMGSVLFYERTAHRQMTICPVLADTEWVGLYNLRTQMYSNVCYGDNLKRPARN